MDLSFFYFEFHIGSFLLSAHDVFEFLGYLVGYRYYKYLQKRGDAYNSKERTILFIATLCGAYLGSKSLGYLEHLQDVNVESGKTIVGGLLGGLLFVEIAKKIMHCTKSSGDLITFPIILGLIIGRIGCFLSGLKDGTHGMQTSLPWGIDLGDGVLRHPVQIYEILFLILLFFIIQSYEKYYKNFSDGNKFISFLFPYLVFRFLVEFIKPISIFFIGLSAIQIACLIGILYYTAILISKQFFRTP